MARPLLWLLPGESEEEVVDEGGELVADQDPVLVDQVVGGDVGVGPAESLLQRVPLEGRNHVMLCQTQEVNGGGQVKTETLIPMERCCSFQGGPATSWKHRRPKSRETSGKVPPPPPPPPPSRQDEPPHDRRCYITTRKLCSPLCVSMETRYVAAPGGCDDQIRGDSQLWPGRRPPPRRGGWTQRCCLRSGIRTAELEPARNNPAECSASLPGCF